MPAQLSTKIVYRFMGVCTAYESLLFDFWEALKVNSVWSSDCFKWHLHLHNQDSWFERVFVRVVALTWFFLLHSDSLSFSYHIMFPYLSQPLRPLFPSLHLHISPSSPCLRRLRRYEENHDCQAEHARFATSHPGLGQRHNLKLIQSPTGLSQWCKFVFRF